MSGILDDLIKAIEQEETTPAPETNEHSMLSHSEQFERYIKDDNIGVADDKGK